MKSVDFLKDTESIRKEVELKTSNCLEQAKIRYSNEDERALDGMCNRYTSIINSKLECLKQDNESEKLCCLCEEEKSWSTFLETYQDIICNFDLF